MPLPLLTNVSTVFQRFPEVSALLDSLPAPDPSKAGRAAAIAGAVTLGLLALVYNDRAVFHSRRKGVVHAKGHPLVGSLIYQIATAHRIYDEFLEGCEKYDALSIYLTSLGAPDTIFTLDPANIEYVLKTNFGNYVKGHETLDLMTDLFGHGIFVADGEQWRYQRKAASAIFNVVNFRDQFTEVFVKELGVLSEHIFDKKALNGTPIDFHDVMYKFTLDSFVALGFGKQLNSLLSKEKVPFAASFDICQKVCSDRFINPFTDSIDSLKVFIPGAMRVKDHIKIIDDFAYTLVKERRQQLARGEEYRDLLSRFMAARNSQGELLNDKELRDTALNFIIAGRDTTAQALSWGFYLLMEHPHVEEKLLEEINEHIPQDRQVEAAELYEITKKMNYAHAVLYEVLRLYPSVPANSKVALEDDILPDGSHVKKGDFVAWSGYAMARSNKVWDHAKEFRPERWITPQGELRRESAGKWPAFHAGPRICLGQSLATLEALIAIIMLLKRYKFRLVPGQEITYELSLTNPMKYGMKVFVERR